MPQAPFIPVIPAGGAGTRLWPLSRRSRPKFLLDLTGSGASLLQQTVSRLAPLADRPPIVVTGVGHQEAVREQMTALKSLKSLKDLSAATASDVAPSDVTEPSALSAPPGQSVQDSATTSHVRVLAEPSPRNSMPAIALAAALVERDDPEAVIGSFAADHLIGDHSAFAAAVTAARRAAELGYLVTLGIEPSYPATGFGYIEQGEGGDVDRRAIAELRAAGASPVSRFVEKPDRVSAEQFLAQGSFFWNAGMFVVRARVLLDELAAQIPALAAGARKIAAAHGTADYDSVLAETWPRLTNIAIDHALAEPLAAEGKVAVVPAAFDWDDVGDFEALARQLRDSVPGSSSSSDSSVSSVSSASSVSSVPSGSSEPGDSEGQDASDVRVLGSSTVDAVRSTATVYGSTDRHIALVGLRGISIVDTEDVLLVLADEEAQALTEIVSGLDEQGRGRLL